MLARLLRTSEWRRVRVSVRRRLGCREESVRLSALLSGGRVRQSGEILELSLRAGLRPGEAPLHSDLLRPGEAPLHSDLLRPGEAPLHSDLLRPGEAPLHSDLLRAALGERVAVDLSATTNASLSEPSRKAVYEQELPYDSAVSLGPAEERAVKHVSEERLRRDCLGAEGLRGDCLGAEGLRGDCLGTEGLERFGLKAEEQREYAMEQVQRFWSEREHNDSSIFVTVASGEGLDVASVLALYHALNIDDKEGRVAQFKEGRVPLLALVEQIDAAVRVIVDQWRAARTKTL